MRNRKELMVGDLPPPGHWRAKVVKPEFEPRQAGKPYVMVVHKRLEKGFTLDGCYTLLEPEVDEARVEMARTYHVSEEDGWLPMSPKQRPWWAQNADPVDYVAYWIAK